MAITKEDLTEAVKRLTDPKRRVEIGSGDKNVAIAIHRAGDSVQGSVTSAATLILDAFEAKDTKIGLKVVQVPGDLQKEGWFYGPIPDIEAAVDFVRNNGDRLIEQVLKEQAQKTQVRSEKKGPTPPWTQRQ